MGALSDLEIVLRGLRCLQPEELADLAPMAGTGRPSGPETPGAHYLASLRDVLADKIERDGGAPDPELVPATVSVWDVVPDGRTAWDTFLDLEAFHTDHARKHHLTTDGVRIVLELIGCDFWRELLTAHVPERFYL
ncbi:hypothetical protein [Micromonospora sp. NPDC047730]|uniref:hypothetical protein n=1 Tax=Micromonospora sp. NPDC047730 TaxID=3364253 RepID=UPI00371C4FC0